MYCDIAEVCLFGCLLDKPWHSWILIWWEEENSCLSVWSLSGLNEINLWLCTMKFQTRREEQKGFVIIDYSQEKINHLLQRMWFMLFLLWHGPSFVDELIRGDWLWFPVMNISIEKCFDGTLLLFRCCSRRSSIRHGFLHSNWSIWVEGGLAWKESFVINAATCACKLID